MKPKVLVTRRIPETGIRILKEHCEIRYRDALEPMGREELLKEIRDVDALYCTLSEKVDRGVIDAGKNLRVVATMSVGVDHIDVDYATSRGIFVVYTPGVLTETTADFAWALLMAAARRVVEGDRLIRAGGWRFSWAPTMMLGYDVHGKVLGIIGFGRIGQAVAKRAKGFDMKVLYYDIERREDLEKKLGVEYRPMDEILREADFITLHIPLTPQTERLIGERELRMMKKTAILINTSRGKVIDQEALIRALKMGWIAAAGLDVFDEEPLPTDSPLINLENVVLTPHIASASYETRSKMAEYAASGLISILKGEVPDNLYNREVLKIRPLSDVKMI
ncbi:MAG: glyoxylate reductase [Nitrososphaeria archaeon]|nr:glyoxylate reductase [Nitrososphaeria archaeon]